MHSWNKPQRHQQERQEREVKSELGYNRAPLELDLNYYEIKDIREENDWKARSDFFLNEVDYDVTYRTRDGRNRIEKRFKFLAKLFLTTQSL